MTQAEEIDKTFDDAIVRQRQLGVRGGDAAIDDGTTELETAINILLPGTSLLDKDRKVVVLGAAATGKSCLMRRVLVTCAEKLSDGDGALVPVMILLIDLGRLMSKKKLTEKDDLFLEHVKTVHGENSARFKMLKRCWEKRRVLLLLDGLDEAGNQKQAIERWISQTLAKNEEQRLVVSSRHTCFDEDVFAAFKFVLIMPLSQRMQIEVVKRRLGERREGPAVVAYVQRLLHERHEYAEMAQNALMLSLLISVLSQQFSNRRSSGIAAKEDDGAERRRQGMTRAQLYALATKLMLHKSSSNKVLMRRDVHSVAVARELALLATDECRELLEQLAIDTHRRNERDIRSKNMVHTVQRVIDSTTANLAHDDTTAEQDAQDLKKGDLFTDILSALNLHVRKGRVALFVCLEEDYATEGSALETTFRFAHLTFQEFYAGCFIAKKVQEAFRAGATHKQCQKNVRKALTEFFSSASRRPAEENDDTTRKTVTLDLLHHPWWKCTFLFCAGVLGGELDTSYAGDLFPCFLDILINVARNDLSGATVCLLRKMLDEVPADKPFMERARDDVNKTIARMRPTAMLVRALLHPSAHLRKLALTEVKDFQLDTRLLTDDVMKALGTSTDDVAGTAPWYEQESAVDALALLDCSSDAVVECLVTRWRRSNLSAAQREAAAQAIVTLGDKATRHGAVVKALLAQYKENGVQLAKHAWKFGVRDRGVLGIVAQNLVAGAM